MGGRYRQAIPGTREGGEENIEKSREKVRVKEEIIKEIIATSEDHQAKISKCPQDQQPAENQKECGESYRLILNEKMNTIDHSLFIVHQLLKLRPTANIQDISASRKSSKVPFSTACVLFQVKKQTKNEQSYLNIFKQPQKDSTNKSWEN